ncbi:MAG: ABC transporter permease [Chloroflexota bacterium]|nr:ABC transporter permease [Chloroflexota bacterium]
MRRFLVRRLLFVIITFIGATVAMFSLTQLATDPRVLFVPRQGWGITQEQWDALTVRLGLDRPVVVQYFSWLGRMLKGDMGESLSQQQPVRQILMSKFGATLRLALAGWIIAVLIGIPTGVLAAVRRGTVWDYLGRSIAVFGQAMPPFWVGIMLMVLFGVVLGWLPTTGAGRGISIKHYILPAFTLGWYPAAALMRLTRSSMLEILDSEYVKFARAKGMGEWTVIWKHAFKNALIPPLTSSLLLMAGFLHGTLVVEYVFAWPGVARQALYYGVFTNDFPLLLGGVVVFVVIFLAFALVADIAYGFVDPRIRYQ